MPPLIKDSMYTAAALALLCSCGTAGVDEPGAGSTSPGPSSSSSASSTTSLPLVPRTTAPPKSPSDVFTPFTLTAEVVGVADGCAELDDDGVAWALAGRHGLEVGDVVDLRVIASPNARLPCAGAPLEMLAGAPSPR